MNNEIKQAAETIKNLQSKSLELFKSIENIEMTKKEKELYLDAKKIFESGNVNEIHKLIAKVKKCQQK